MTYNKNNTLSDYKIQQFYDDKICNIDGIDTSFDVADCIKIGPVKVVILG